MCFKLPPHLRLLFCLLFSLGLHGGVSSFDWFEDSSFPQSSAAPVTIALVSASDTVRPLTTGKLHSQPYSQPVNTVSRAKLTRASSPQKKTAIKPDSMVRKSPSNKPLPVVSPDGPEVKTPPPELVCMVPHEAMSDQTPAPPTEVKMSSGPAETNDAAAISGTTLSADHADAVGSTKPSGTHELLDAIPDYRNNPMPEYPRLARQRHWQGVVWLLVDVSDEGLVENLHVEQSCGHSVLDRAASRTVKHWRFAPARRAGIPTASQVRIPIRFRLEDS